ncbi:MAG: alpha-amylase family glycosyl hydrolase [Butyribacter sp.]|nr:alpha-amylase family glycosyl hydrolase [bacterium]MDY3855403.1 alpha-amylase family glycosyl hydrolase [Butyribacter sp.]
MIKENSLFEYRVGKALPLGVTKVTEGVQFAVYLPKSEVCFLKLYKKGRKVPSFVVELKGKFKTGSVFSAIINKSAKMSDARDIAEILTQDYEYLYEADGVSFVDPYAAGITGRQHWGKRMAEKKPVRGSICLEHFDWEEDTPLRIPYADMILYQLHVRGYTKHRSSGVQHKGTFRGLMEKIPYLKDLGINAVMLLPVYEFSEVADVEDDGEELAAVAKVQEKTSRINYWGYGSENTFYFAPKMSYTSQVASPSTEFKEMVKAFHENGIEVLLDIYFQPGTNLFLMTDCLRSWVLQYHVDGFRVNQEIMPSLSMASDPILSGVKLLGSYWDVNMLHSAKITGQKNALGEYNEGFMNDIRRFLKSDEGMVEKAAGYFSRNAKEYSYVNFITHVNGFTLMDLVSYDIKHNEANGEMNQDGTEFNYSWNCGVEGKTRKKAILDRRMIQIRNAFLMLLTSQGAPMILAGDELGNTQSGNNNAYCQDNDISYINWNRTKTSEEIHTFVKQAIAFRKAFPVLHREEPVMLTDTLSCGMPDLSIHGMQAWKPDYSNYSRMLGMLYYGEYAGRKEGRSVYIIYNMYWEAKSFDLPNLPKGKNWRVMIDTYDNTFDTKLLTAKKKTAKTGTRKKKQQPVLSKKTVVPPRTTVIFVEE